MEGPAMFPSSVCIYIYIYVYNTDDGNFEPSYIPPPFSRNGLSIENIPDLMTTNIPVCQTSAESALPQCWKVTTWLWAHRQKNDWIRPYQLFKARLVVIIPVLFWLVERGKHHSRISDVIFLDSDPLEAAGHRSAGRLSSKQHICNNKRISTQINWTICMYII